MDEALDHCDCDGVVAEDLAPGAEGVSLVTIRLARSQRRATSMNIRFAAWGSNGM